jgi:hypothetical protein
MYGNQRRLLDNRPKPSIMLCCLLERLMCLNTRKSINHLYHIWPKVGNSRVSRVIINCRPSVSSLADKPIYVPNPTNVPSAPPTVTADLRNGSTASVTKFSFVADSVPLGSANNANSVTEAVREGVGSLGKWPVTGNG